MEPCLLEGGAWRSTEGSWHAARSSPGPWTDLSLGNNSATSLSVDSVESARALRAPRLVLWDFFWTGGHEGSQPSLQQSALGPGTRLSALLLTTHNAKSTFAQTSGPLLVPPLALSPEVPLLFALDGGGRSLLSSPLGYCQPVLGLCLWN